MQLEKNLPAEFCLKKQGVEFLVDLFQGSESWSLYASSSVCLERPRPSISLFGHKTKSSVPSPNHIFCGGPIRAIIHSPLIPHLALPKQLIHDLIFSGSRWMMVLQRLGIVFHHALPANPDGETAMLGNAFRICWSLVTKGTPKS